MNARLAVLGLVWSLGCSNPARDFGSGTASGGAAGGGDLGSSGTGGTRPAGNTGSDNAGSSGTRDAAGDGAAGDGAAGDGAAGDGTAGDGAAGATQTGSALKVLSVTPEGTSATTRSSISVTCSQPVTRESVSSAVVVTDERGPVAGQFSVAGAVATFEPRGSLCLARSYQISVAAGVSTPAGLHLAGAKSYPFAIPDGEWGERQTVRANATVLNSPAAAIDRDGNALLAWTETPDNTLGVNYYDARVSAWNGAQEPPVVPSNGAPGPPLVGLANGHALVVYPGYGAAERTKNGVWSVTDSADLLGSVGNFATPSLAVAANGTALLAWNDRYGSVGASAFTPATDAGKPGFWVKPTASAVSGWGTQQYVHALPDGSFMMLFSAHPGPSQLASNLSAQRFVPASGWSAEHKIAAGDQYFKTAQDNFGNLLLVGEGGTPVARYDYAIDSWTF
ncbi:MAG: Ig-like domain-containing protein, partial [Polyangiaceae bacterium]